MYINVSSLRAGKMVSGSSALSREGSSFFSYGTKIAEIHTNAQGIALHCTTRKYSVTTSKQLPALKSFYIKQGYTIVDSEVIA